MQLSVIEPIVLMKIGGDRYSSLSVDANAEKVEDFANLHTCVNLAREEIKLNTTIPSLLKWTSAIATVASQKAYSLPSDFDIPVKVFYTSDTEEFELEQVYPANLLEKVANTTAEGIPDWYMILGQSSALVQIELYNIPNKVQSFKAIYKPVLTEYTISTSEDILMKKYPKTVINFATAFAFQIIKKDSAMHDKYMMLGLADCSKIDLRELKADSSYKELPDALLRTRRSSRLSK